MALYSTLRMPLLLSAISAPEVNQLYYLPFLCHLSAACHLRPCASSLHTQSTVLPHILQRTVLVAVSRPNNLLESSLQVDIDPILFHTHTLDPILPMVMSVRHNFCYRLRPLFHFGAYLQFWAGFVVNCVRCCAMSYKLSGIAHPALRSAVLLSSVAVPGADLFTH